MYYYDVSDELILETSIRVVAEVCVCVCTVQYICHICDIHVYTVHLHFVSILLFNRIFPAKKTHDFFHMSWQWTYVLWPATSVSTRSIDPFHLENSATGKINCSRITVAGKRVIRDYQLLLTINFLRIIRCTANWKFCSDNICDLLSKTQSF